MATRLFLAAINIERRHALLCSLPTELLRNVLLHVEPKDFVIFASANRHLRDAVPACIDQDLATRNVAPLWKWFEGNGNPFPSTIRCSLS
ncbi:hypothetical protein HDU96_002622 [Phlyctochytrium bullatum]|nr:hypothetical protein HDU96_002622 [Phlyctochytrium bullatum]